jgi:uncharacterized protein YbjT (DUF2867 family)
VLRRQPDLAGEQRAQPPLADTDPGLTVTTTIGPADAILLLSPAGPGAPGNDLAMLAAAVRAGIPRVVKLSAIGTPDGPVTDGLGSWHQPGEQAVQQSGAAWTVLRPTTFASNTLAWAADIRAGRPIINLFGDGRQGIIDPADVAAVAAEALTAPGHEGRTYTLTGPALLSVPEQIAELADVLNRPIETVDRRPSVDLFPPAIAEVAVAGAALVRAGGNAIVTADVERVLGRRPRTFRAWAEQHRADF